MVELMCKICGEGVERCEGYVPCEIRFVWCKRCGTFYSEGAMAIVTARGVEDIPQTLTNLNEGKYDELEGLRLVGGADIVGGRNGGGDRGGNHEQSNPPF